MDDAAQADQEATASSEDNANALHLVGIAASAGGLEAVSLLVQTLPQTANAVYVIAQHMSPKHKSVLSTLISRETNLQVLELETDTVPAPNTIYVTPPNTDVTYEDGRLRLRNPSGHPASPKPSADRLFKSLAAQSGENSVGIVLSGTGSDGSYGVQAIREAGGITIAQDPASAKYDGMPTSAIETGCIDLTLSPEMIGTHLEKILALPRNFNAFRKIMDRPNPLSELFGILLARTKVDFTDYKENTLNRRIARRMNALGIESYDTYVDFCRTNAGEVDALHRDLLISVTRFFRDPAQFTKLRGEIETLVAQRGDGPIRIWVVGCATGEEAYSVAVLIADILGGLEALARRKVQIFATDIDQNAIEVARRGVYPITAAQDIPQNYLSDYFTISDGEVAVRSELRAVTLFSHHNVFQDPPFINVDMVSIRNVLIYFNLALQERVLSRLHYALGPGGLLFLGTSETVGEMSVYFEARDGADKVFAKRRGVGGELRIEPGARLYQPAQTRAGTPPDKPAEVAWENQLSLARAVAPNGVICTRNGNIIEVLGDISPFIQIQAGASTALSTKMLRDPLRTEALSLISVALRSEARRDGRWHEMSLPVGNRVQLQVFPFTNQPGGELQFLLAINAKFEDEPAQILSGDSALTQRAYIERMEQEVKATQEALQQTIEELQTSNEELQSSNEELQSTNEEFQATNEELETANEELQSTNEELLTVNEELQISSAERLALASELEATMISAPYVIALADEALMLRRLSEVGLRFFGLDEIPPSGVHLSQCALPPGFPALAPLANSVLRLHEERRIPVLSNGTYYAMLMSPVHDVHKKLIGLSITITEYDDAPLEQIVELISGVTDVAYWTYNFDTEALVWSPKMFGLFKLDPSGDPLSWSEAKDLLHPDDRPRVGHGLETLLDTGAPFSEQVRVFDGAGGTLVVEGTTMLLRDSHGQPQQLLGVVWNTAEDTDRQMKLSHLKSVHDDLGLGFFSFDRHQSQTDWGRATFDLLHLDPAVADTELETLLAALHPEDRGVAQEAFSEAWAHGESFAFTARLAPAGGATARVAIKGQAWRNKAGVITHLFGSVRRVPSEGA